MASHEARLYHLGVAAPKRSTLADANAQRPAAVFGEMFSCTLEPGPSLVCARHAADAIRLIDRSRITLNALSRGWAHYDTTCDGMKLHVVYDPDAIDAGAILRSLRHARTTWLQANAMPIEPGATYVFDMGY